MDRRLHQAAARESRLRTDCEEERERAGRCRADVTPDRPFGRRRSAIRFRLISNRPKLGLDANARIAVVVGPVTGSDGPFRRPLPKSRARRHHPPSPGSPRVDAFDESVVARVPRGGRVPDGRAREWKISGRSSAPSTLAGRCSTCAATATTATFIASTGAMTPSVRLTVERASASTGGSIRRRRRPLHARPVGACAGAK
jgi:hypothetical protein